MVRAAARDPRGAVTSVLVVDGRPADRELLATVLGHAGYAVAEAANGEVAIELARSQRPDLIITHILMPDMDGYELVSKLRSEHVTADIRVIYYTATYLVEEVRSSSPGRAGSRRSWSSHATRGDHPRGQRSPHVPSSVTSGPDVWGVPTASTCGCSTPN